MFPSLTIAKLLAGLALLVAVFGAGWTVNGWRWQDKYTARENVLLAQANAAQVKYAADIKKTADDAEEAVANHEEAEGKLNSQITALKEKLANAKFTRPSVAGQADCTYPFSVSLPAAINELQRTAEGTDVPASGTDAPSPAGTTDAAAATSAVDGGTLVKHYAEVMRIYGQCKAQLDAIRLWDAK